MRHLTDEECEERFKKWEGPASNAIYGIDPEEWERMDTNYRAYKMCECELNRFRRIFSEEVFERKLGEEVKRREYWKGINESTNR